MRGPQSVSVFFLTETWHDAELAVIKWSIAPFTPRLRTDALLVNRGDVAVVAELAFD
jgi:hypothetical protein